LIVLGSLYIYLNFREELYGAVLRCLVESDRQEDAEKLFQSMEKGQNRMNVLPSSYSFDALILGRIRNCDWDGATDLYDQMKKRGIFASSQAVEGLLLAHHQIGGPEAVMGAVQSLINDSNNARLGESSFRLLCKVLLPPDLEHDEHSFDNFRQKIRSIGEGKDSDLRDPSLKLVRTLRIAEIESDRPRSYHKTATAMQEIQDKAWVDATNHLILFARALSKSSEAR
jgi:pentatricopeptide repeat protein